MMVVDVIFSLLELLLDLSKSLNYFYMGRGVIVALDSLKV